MSAAPNPVDASRAAFYWSNPSGVATRLKHPRAHRTLAFQAAATSVALGALFSAMATLGSWSTLDDCMMKAHARGTPAYKLLHADDKHSQHIFIALFHTTYIGFIISTILESSTGVRTGGASVGRCSNLAQIAGFWVADAVIAYAWRVVLYLCVVLPLGLRITGTNCGTSKIISGHSHFYCFHMLQLGYTTFCDSRPFLPPRPKRPARSLGDSGDPRFVAWLVSTCVKLYAFAVILWTVGTLQQTYVLGFHSLRHMLAGLAASMFTFASLVSILQTLLTLQFAE